MSKQNTDCCFVFGEQYENINFDFKLLDNYTTIGYNNVIDFYNPTIYMSNSKEILLKFIDNNTFNDNTTYLLNPTSLIANCVNIADMSFWSDNKKIKSRLNNYLDKNILTKLQNLVTSKSNVYLIKNLKKMERTKNISDVMDKQLLTKNIKYSLKYKNIMPLMVLKYIAINKIQTVFLVCCNLNKYIDSDKKIICDGIKKRLAKHNNINFINASIEENELLDFVPNYDLIKMYTYYKKNNFDTNTLVKDYINFCKIDSMNRQTKQSAILTLFGELNNIINYASEFDYDKYIYVKKLNCC